MKWLAVLILAASPALAQDGTGDGAAIFHTGAGLQARLGRADGPLLPQGQFSCAGCHGADGRGGTEGGSQPAPPIDWASLATATPERPAYDEAGFARLLSTGVTPSGRVISARMPRFEGAAQTVDALRAHLQVLNVREREGVTADRVGLALPRDPAARDAALAAMAAFNAEGGAYGRQVMASDPSFIDLEAALATLLPRLEQARSARLQSLLEEDRDLRPLGDLVPGARIAGTVDQLGPRLPAILSEAAEVQAVGPPSEAMAWALRSHHGAQAADAFAATRAVLGLLRDQGRQPTRSRLARALETLDLDPMTKVYRQIGK